jgi:hypothetical protein
MPKVQGSYGGAAPDRGAPQQGGYAGAQKGKTGPQAGPQPVSRDASGASRPSTGKGDRGYAQQPQARPQPQQMPQAKPAARPAPAAPQAKPQKPTAISGAGGSGKADRAASQRGKESMPQGARSKGGGGGGGGAAGGGGGKKGKR